MIGFHSNSWFVGHFLWVAVIVVGAANAQAASHRSEHFVVEAPTTGIARQVAEAAEQWRGQISRQWLGRDLGEWREICSITVEIDGERCQGNTRFVRRYESWSGAQISIKGPLDRLLTEVLPHEVTHAVLTLHLGRPLPRWADEGAAMLAEGGSRQTDNDRRILRLAHRNAVYSLEELLGSRDYPSSRQVFYPQAYSLTRFLVVLRGRAAFLAFLEAGMNHNWDEAIKAHYGFEGIRGLEKAWEEHLKAVEVFVLAQDVCRDSVVAVSSTWRIASSRPLYAMVGGR